MYQHPPCPSSSAAAPVLHLQVRDRWSSLVNTCFAPYGAVDARIKPGDDFQRMWYAHPNATAVERIIDVTLEEAGDIPANAAQVRARDITMKGFNFTEVTKAGLYRGRLSNLYQCAPLSWFDSLCDHVTSRLHNLSGDGQCRYMRRPPPRWIASGKMSARDAAPVASHSVADGLDTSTWQLRLLHVEQCRWPDWCDQAQSSLCCSVLGRSA